MTKSDEVVLIDGGLGTELNEMGYVLSDCKFWSGKPVLYNPEILKRAHLNYLECGAKIIETASYQLTTDFLIKELNITFDEAKAIIKKSVEIADDARKEFKDEKIKIAGSVGPYGAILCDMSEFDGSYVKDLTPEFLVEWHRPRLEALLEAKCDLIAIETIPSIKEATALVNLLAEYPNARAWLSFTCRDGAHLFIGDTFKDAFNKFKHNKQLIAIGINCTSPNFVSSLLKSIQEDIDQSTLPLIVYTNNGKTWDINAKDFKSEYDDPEQVYSYLSEWIQLGVRYLGGCCDINSKDLKKINEFIQDYNRNKNKSSSN